MLLAVCYIDDNDAQKVRVVAYASLQHGTTGTSTARRLSSLSSFGCCWPQVKFMVEIAHSPLYETVLSSCPSVSSKSCPCAEIQKDRAIFLTNLG
jgi:hypothetical protein